MSQSDPLFSRSGNANPLSTAALSAEQVGIARKCETIILQRLAGIGQAHAAHAMGLSESTISRLKDGDIARFSNLLAVCDLKVTPSAYRCYRPDTLQAILVLARERLAQTQNINELEWEDE